MKMGNDPRVTFENITPEKAANFLKHNENNRRQDHNHILAMSRSMTDGHWLTTHQGIGIDEDGNLVDGQQRLEAIIHSGTTQRMMVTRNLMPEVYKVLDAGRLRSPAQRLEHDGFIHTSTLAGLLFLLHAHDIMGGDLSVTVSRGKKPDYERMLDLVGQHPEAQAAAAMAGNTKGLRRFFAPAIGAYLLNHIMEVEDEEYARYWCDALIDPLAAGLKSGLNNRNQTIGDPIYVLRERLLWFKAEKRPPTRAEVLATIIKGWNKHRRNEEININALRWRTTGPKKEPFPDFED